MLKIIFISFLELMFFQSARAQRRGNVTLYMAKPNIIVGTKDSADYVLEIAMPADSSSGEKINSIKEFYTNGKLKLTCKAVITVKGQVANIKYTGVQTEFYENGNLKSKSTYENGRLNGLINYYDPKGNLSEIEEYNQKNGLTKFIECRDTMGNIITKNGKGKWIDYNWETKKITNEGLVLDSLQDGEWHGTLSDTNRYVCVFNKGESVSGAGYDKEGVAHYFINFEAAPSYPGGPKAFNQFLAKTVIFPNVDKRDGTNGRVVVTFVIEKDGSITNVTAVSGPSQTIKDAAVAAVVSSPRWQPALSYGMPARVQFTISFNFNL